MIKKQYRKITVWPRAGAAALLLALACILCVSASAAAAPTIKLLENTDAKAGEVTISVNVTDFDLDEGSKDHGYIVYYLDAPAPTYYEHSAVSKAGTYAVSTATSYTWQGVTPGEHTFSVQLADSGVMPLPLPVTDTAVIPVGAPDGAPQLTVANPADGDTLAPGNIWIFAEVAGFIVSREDMGVINRTGEGHLIYYIDEAPPTDQGVPAKTDTCAVSADTRHLWRSVTQGSHTLSVQLVNNDDTPLDTPVFVTITLDVKP